MAEEDLEFYAVINSPFGLERIIYILCLFSETVRGEGLPRGALATVTMWEHRLLPKQGRPLQFPSANMGKGSA